MQSAGSYTHLPQLTLFPKGVNIVTIGEPAVIFQDGAPGGCSVRMPRMAIPKDVKFQIRALEVTKDIDPKSVIAPAPECPAPESGK
jgi:hypothetical protein